MNPIGAAIAYVLDTHQSVFITGKAGTGKTTLLERLTKRCDRQFAVVAPTGVAALRAGGSTIHSLLKIPVGTIIPELTNDIPSGFLSWKTLRDRWRVGSEVRELLEVLEVLFIDEVSMVRPDLLDAVDQVLRVVRGKSDQPFGGIQVVYLGDLFQLPPVYSGLEMRELSKYYATPYFYSSKAVQEQKPVMIELDRVFRQQDPNFISLLNQIRLGRIDTYALSCLNERVLSQPLGIETGGHLTKSIPLLTTHVRKAQLINESELNRLTTPQHLFEAEVTGSFQRGSCPADEKLYLKVGARVMMLKNDSERPARYFNGKIGMVEAINNKYLTIQFDDGHDPLFLERETWKQLSYRYSKQSKRIERVAIGSYRQFPVKLAWAITVHKSQGLTFDAVRVDLEGAFAPGQVYVALSRCRSLAGLYLNSAIPSRAVRSDPRLHALSASGIFEAAGFDHWQSQHLRTRFGNFRYQFGLEALAGTWLKLTDLLVDTEPVWVDNLVNSVHNLKPLIQDLAQTLMLFGTTPLQPTGERETAANEWAESLSQASQCLVRSRFILDQLNRSIDGLNLTGYNARLVQETQDLVVHLRNCCEDFALDLTEQENWLTDFLSEAVSRWEAHQAEQEIPALPVLSVRFAPYNTKIPDQKDSLRSGSNEVSIRFNRLGQSILSPVIREINKNKLNESADLLKKGSKELGYRALNNETHAVASRSIGERANNPSIRLEGNNRTKGSTTGVSLRGAMTQFGGTPNQPNRSQPDAHAVVPAFVIPKPLGSEPSQLEEALVRLRSELSKQERIPPYRVYTNESLREIVATLPISLAALRHIRGMGPKRVAAFGEQIIAVIASQPSINNPASPTQF